MGGVFFVKKRGPFLNAGCIMYSISVFFIFTILLTWGGCVHTQRIPLPTGLLSVHYYTQIERNLGATDCS